jgi:hypothetical protein
VIGGNNNVKFTHGNPIIKYECNVFLEEED